MTEFKLWCAWIPFWGSVAFDVWHFLITGSFSPMVITDWIGELVYSGDDKFKGVQAVIEWVLGSAWISAMILFFAVSATIKILSPDTQTP